MISRKRQILTGITLIILAPVIFFSIPIAFRAFCPPHGTEIFSCEKSIGVISFPVSLTMLIAGIIVTTRGATK